MNYGVFFKGDGEIGLVIAICFVVGFFVGLLLIRLTRRKTSKAAPEENNDIKPHEEPATMQQGEVSEDNQEPIREVYVSDRDRSLAAAGIAVGGPMRASLPTSNTCGLAAKGQTGYLTNVFCIRKGRTELVELMLAEPLGNGLDREPSVPFHGRYMAIEIKEGVFESYDPREEPVIRKNTPQECFDATHWNDEVDGVYANQSETSEKISMFIIGLAIVLNFIVCLVALGKLGGK